MTDLITIKEHNGKQAVSARELHEFLEVKAHFRNWIERMFDYGFDESIDYERANIFVRGNEAKDYVLTLDCAKEISMIQRTDKGKQARQYFINCEKRLKEGSSLIQKALENMVDDRIQKALQEEKIKQDFPSEISYVDLDGTLFYHARESHLYLGYRDIVHSFIKEQEQLGNAVKLPISDKKTAWYLNAKGLRALTDKRRNPKSIMLNRIIV